MKDPFNQTKEIAYHEAYFRETEDRHIGLLIAEYREGIAFGVGLAGVSESCFLDYETAQVVADTLLSMIEHGKKKQ